MDIMVMEKFFVSDISEAYTISEETREDDDE